MSDIIYHVCITIHKTKLNILHMVIYIILGNGGGLFDCECTRKK
jgi:hypothetical protein